MEKEDYTFYCDKCRYGCKFKSEYDKHCDTGLHKTGKRKPRSDKKEDNYKCKQCDYETHNIGNYKIHVLNNHSDEKTRIKSFKHYVKNVGLVLI